MAEIHSNALPLANWLHDFSESFALSRWLFLRMLGVVYGCAFLSLTVQLRGLIGEKGILPVGEFFEDIKNRLGTRAYRLLPSVFWLGTSDRALLTACGIGLAASLSLMLGFLELPCLIVLYISYLSLMVAGQDFLAFQWDVLLLETGLLAIFFAPAELWTGTQPAADVSPVALFLLWWLLFRLMFESGAVKLSCGDETWRRLTSLKVHYETQPLPNRVAWYFHQLPAPFQRFCVAMVLTIEIVLPFFIFVPPPLRYLAAAGFALLMLMIFITGNYNFFNLLTLALCVLLIDDNVWRNILPAGLLPDAGTTVTENLGPASLPMIWVLHVCVALVIILVSLPQVIQSAFPNVGTPQFIERLQRWIQPLHAVNSYGLFRHMTLSRPEIIIEGSMDGSQWEAYEFRYKPGELDRPPGFVAPHQPRLDWQMWFAALSNFYGTLWFQRFVLRLFEGAEPVLRLLKSSPFSGSPRYIRALLYEYEFTTAAEKKQTGHWWKRKRLGLYAPVMMRRESPEDEEPGT